MMRAQRVFLASGATLALLFGGMPVAAGNEVDVAEDVAELIADVAPAQGTVVVGVSAGEAVEARVDDARTTVSFDPADPIKIEDAAAAGGVFEVALPLELNVDHGVVGSDGTVVFEANDGGAHAAVQVLDQGDTRIQTITQDVNGPHEFTYTFGDGFLPAETPDGDVAIVKDLGNGELAIMAVDDAWARDADGRAVSTHYEVSGATLVQVLDTDSSTVYPVVADPRFRWWNLAYSAKFNRAETRSMANAGGAVGLCVTLTRLWPASVSFCAAYGAYIFTQAAIANGDRMCILITATPPPLVFRYKDNDCY